ncbi:GNAT family N-acetyltransferase [Ferrimonas balearica]|uniref:GNAT family N-acetyltransferase n=1 Tax=Ferrimonas balearica TaxID=44012 RepID=UPI001C5AA2B7|nr:GNAT family N-acetyltransferase [Ferrimonas balearica]MBW3166470.1 GNAT family N-acetyltransferase [Ferrimonas balearica]
MKTVRQRNPKTGIEESVDISHANNETMANMALEQFTMAYDQRLIELDPAMFVEGMMMHHDMPEPNIHRFTYAIVEDGEIMANAVVVVSDPYNGAVCFDLSYAVPEKHKQKGYGSKLVKMVLAEMKAGYLRSMPEFYVELKVEKANAASNALAKKFKTEDGQGSDSINRYFVHCKK